MTSANPTNTPPPPGDGRPLRARGRVTDAERQRIRDLADAGGTVRSIAADVGRSHHTVSRVAGDRLAARRAQTARATEARQIDAAAEAATARGRYIRAANIALGRWAEVDRADHRGAADEARSAAQLATAWARIDERVERATARHGDSQVDLYLAVMGGHATDDQRAEIARATGLTRLGPPDESWRDLLPLDHPDAPHTAGTTKEDT